MIRRQSRFLSERIATRDTITNGTFIDFKYKSAPVDQFPFVYVISDNDGYIFGINLNELNERNFSIFIKLIKTLPQLKETTMKSRGLRIYNYIRTQRGDLLAAYRTYLKGEILEPRLRKVVL